MIDKVKSGLFFLILLGVLATGSAMAQNFSGAFSGMRDNGQPIQIEADRLEVTDAKGVAVFAGNVSVVQGSTILKTSKLKVHYRRGGRTKSPAGNVAKIIASGKVAVRSGNQTASANSAVVDLDNKTAILTGDVVVSQGSNVVSGCRLNINLATNAAKLEPCGKKSQANKSNGRVRMIFTPGSTN